MAAKKILLIDDEKALCEIIKMNLEGSGKFNVISAYNGKEGLKLAREQRPDVILLDIMMPKMDGFEVLENLKETQATMAIPVIMLSARAEDAAKIKANEMYSAYYITKPVSTDEIIAKIEWILEVSGKGSGSDSK